MADRKTAMEELLEVIDYLAPPSPVKGQIDRRGRCGIESGPVPGKPGAWDGGKQWAKTDAWISRVVKRAKKEAARG